MPNPLSRISWDWIKCFIEVANMESISEASKSLNITAATVSRQISSLEKHLSFELFLRRQSGMLLTEAGSLLLPHAISMRDSMNCIGLQALAQDTSNEGLVRISAATSIAYNVLPILLKKFNKEQPGIILEIISFDSHNNLSKRESDIAICFTEPTQAEVIAKRVGKFSMSVFATKKYIEKNGLPLPEDASFFKHHFIDVAPQMYLKEYLARFGLDSDSNKIICTTFDYSISWQMIKESVGVGLGLDFLASPDCEIVNVLPEATFFTDPLWIAMHKGVRQQPRIKTVADFLIRELINLSSN